MIRTEILELEKLGPLPESQTAEDYNLQRQEQLLNQISKPVSDDEARILCRLFGPDDCYGIAWTLLHLIETAPGWPIRECLKSSENQWIVRLRESATRAGLME
jgi:hypothetical protein